MSTPEYPIYPCTIHKNSSPIEERLLRTMPSRQPPKDSVADSIHAKDSAVTTVHGDLASTTTSLAFLVLTPEPPSNSSGSSSEGTVKFITPDWTAETQPDGSGRSDTGGFTKHPSRKRRRSAFSDDSLGEFQHHVEACLEGVKRLRRRSLPPEYLARHRRIASQDSQEQGNQEQDNQEPIEKKALVAYKSWLQKQGSSSKDRSAVYGPRDHGSQRKKGTLTTHFPDQNDESLRKWKESLGIGSGTSLSDPNDPRKVIIESLGLEVSISLQRREVSRLTSE